MSSPAVVALPGLSTSQNPTSSDWLPNLILASKTITAAADLLPFPYVKGAFGPVVPILEAVEKLGKNRDDFKDLCESIAGIVKVLEEEVSRNGADAAFRLKDLCKKLGSLLREIQQDLGEIQQKQKGFRGFLKEFIHSSSIGDRLNKYKMEVNELRDNFVLFCAAQLSIRANALPPPSLPLVPQAQPEPLPPVLTDCPPASQIFQGRKNILAEMHAYFSQDIGKRHVCLLHGLGGSGKTQTALKFLEETEASRFMDVFFIDASTVQTLAAGFVNIALTRSLGKEDKDATRWLATSGTEWLLLLDNANDPNINFYDFFPPGTRGNILITSRNPQLCVHAPHCHHQISNLEEEEAVELLLTSAAQPRTSVTETLAVDIVRVLHCFPLAVVQAGAFVSKTGSLGSYISLYEENKIRLLSTLPTQPYDKYSWSVFTTWDISFQQLSKTAAMFLQICAFLHYDGISETMFSNAVDYIRDGVLPTEADLTGAWYFLNHFLTSLRGWDSLVFSEMVTEIQGYSLIYRDPSTDMLSIHPLVHDWTRNTIGDVNHIQGCAAAVIAMSVDYGLLMFQLLPHLQSLLKEAPDISHRFPSEYAAIYLASSDFQNANALGVFALEKTKEVCSDEHPHTLTAMQQLAVIYSRQGLLTEAEKLQINVLEIIKQVSGPEHLETLQAMGNLARFYSELGKFTDAEKLEVVVLEKRKQILGDNHRATLLAMVNLAITYCGLGKFRDSEELGLVVVEKWKETLGPEHPETLMAMESLGRTYHSLGKYTDAEKLDLFVLEARKRIFGTEHPATLTAMQNFSMSSQSLGNFTDAENLQVIVLEKTKIILGPDHPSTLVAMANLARTYQYLQKFKDSEDLGVILMEKSKRILGSDHPLTLAVMTNLALTYKNLGKYTDSELLGLVVVPKWEVVSGLEHPNTLLAMSNLEATYCSIGKWSDAERLGETVVERMERTFGNEHPDTLLAMSNLAVSYSGLGKFSKSENLGETLVGKMKRIFGKKHPETVVATGNLAVTYHELGKFVNAEKLGQFALKARRKIFGQEHVDTLRTMSNLAATYHALGKIADAAKLEALVLDIKKKSLGPTHPDTMHAMEILMATYLKLGKTKEAEELEDIILDTWEQIPMGTEHPDNFPVAQELVVGPQIPFYRISLSSAHFYPLVIFFFLLVMLLGP